MSGALAASPAVTSPHAANDNDALGNLRAKSLGSHGVTLDYDGKPRLTQVTSTMTGTRNVSYDTRGNITSLGGQGFTGPTTE